MRSEQPPRYDEAYVRELFDRMGRTYDVVNLISSFGFSRLWRSQCVAKARISPGDVVCDLMAGGGECWVPIFRKEASIVSIDFSRVMSERQTELQERLGRPIDIRCENALSTSIDDGSIDAVVCAFGLKTLTTGDMTLLAGEVFRILKPGGRFSFLEISLAEGWWLGPLFRWYVRCVIPFIGKVCLGDIECYRMLWRYTRAFGSCSGFVDQFRQAGLSATTENHFNGCATSISGFKP